MGNEVCQMISNLTIHGYILETDRDAMIYCALDCRLGWRSA